MVYHLATHQLILAGGVGGGGRGRVMEFIWSENIFQKFLDKAIEKKIGLEMRIFFPKIP